MQVYKKKTEAAKKEYLKALAAYRASLVSKGAGDNEGMYGNYTSYGTGPPQQYGAFSPQNALPSPPMSAAPTPPSQQQQQAMMGKKPMMPPQQMMQPPMGMPPHMQPPPHGGGYMQQVGKHLTSAPVCSCNAKFRRVSGSSAAHAAREPASDGIKLPPDVRLPAAAAGEWPADRRPGPDAAALLMYTSRLHKPSHSESRVGGRVLQQRVRCQPLPVKSKLRANLACF